MPPVKRQISPHAAPLRRRATDAERLLWSRLRGRRLGWKFRSQHSIGPFVSASEQSASGTTTSSRTSTASSKPSSSSSTAARIREAETPLP